ncbi:MAG: MFS transporter [Brevibacterium aurantiacum]|uniref:Benzoate transport n=1 Tax=Brevibacterium aurantiacum TaxID=273384 RepID=A0A2A3YYM9_BREAU|nr:MULTISPECIES: MFS transporter [Brevibacterium]MDN5607485.1 MFS transporter [Brevibacterium sp.]AZL05416.1 MFS transporter [Brevibacterium aurantiacum]AZL09001.1 MFS transporter [Brevibacterium aurantiacum]MDN5661314.1 MFS transporter [Brevibacterium aurantiacum]MDN6379335.1 MFS transporter [Brevibacterium aurantiacum]
MSAATPKTTAEATSAPAYKRKALFAAAVGYGLDGFDLLILSFALGGIIATFGLSDVEAGSLSTITLFGAVLGGIIFGSLADRYGRVRVLTWTVLIFAVFTGLSSIAQGYWDMAAYRFIAGIGIGGEFGIGMALAAEAVPANQRARATSWVGVGFQIGVFAAAIVSAPVIALWGWRALFVIGLFPAIFAFVIRRGVQEPDKFVQSQRGQTAGESGDSAELPTFGAKIRALVKDKATVKITFALIVLSTVQNFGYFGIIAWLPNYLSEKMDLGVTKGSLWTAVTVIGMLAGILIFGQVADRLGRRPAFWIFQAGAIVSILVYSQMTDPSALLIGGFFMGAFANGMLGGHGALLAEMYPTQVRATAQNVVFNIGRALGGLAPVVIALLADSFGFAFALALLPTIYIIQFLAMFLLPEKRGVELE